MPAKYFTVDEANALLAEIEPLVGRLLERRAKVSKSGKEIGPLLEDTVSNVGGNTLSELTQDFAAIESLLAEIQSRGCLVKDINVGLLDFLSLRDGREVYLCWRYGEPKIEYYHELHTGFAGRRPL